jgi:hypothetical protein
MTTTTDTSAMTLAQKSDRILAQTRGLSGATPNATRLIEELRLALESNRNDVQRLTAERDEARRSCCEYAAIVDGADNTEGMESGRFHEVAMRYMKERNWDCFKEDDK